MTAAIHRPFALSIRHAPQVLAALKRLAMQPIAEIVASTKGIKFSDDGYPETDIFGEALDKMTVNGNTATIPVKGVITKGLPKVFTALGYCDIDKVSADLNYCLQTKEIETVAMDVDSPGGMVSGVLENYDLMSSLASKKDVMAFTDGLMCSAAYWLCAPAAAMYCTKSAEVGSIGAYTVFTDDSGWLEQMGIKLDVFSSGKFKGMGENPLTDDQKDLIQNEINDLASEFKSNVSKYRTEISDDDMEGQSFMGEKAAEKGFVTGISKNFQNALAKFSNK